MSTHQFLTEQWIEAVRRIKADHVGDATDQAGLVVNATIRGVPFGDGTIEMHSSHGPVIGWEPGHVQGAEFEISLDYATARDLVLDETPNSLELALHASEIEIVGDFDAFREWWHSRVGDDDAAALDRQVRAITA